MLTYAQVTDYFKKREMPPRIMTTEFKERHHAMVAIGREFLCLNLDNNAQLDNFLNKLKNNSGCN